MALDDASDQIGYNRPKRIIREHSGMGSEIVTEPTTFKEDEKPSCPSEDTLFASIETVFIQCEITNGWACERCKTKRKCVSLFSLVAQESTRQRLDSTKAREFILRFESLKRG